MFSFMYFIHLYIYIIAVAVNFIVFVDCCCRLGNDCKRNKQMRQFRFTIIAKNAFAIFSLIVSS